MPNNTKIAILGFGKEGKAVLKFLKKSPQYKNAEISILDQKLDKNYLKNLAQFDIIFRSPGIPYTLSEIQKAIKKGIQFSSATDLFFQTAKKIGCKIIGITGTKGKSTTSTLIYKILKAAGLDAILAGNIGKPAIDILLKLKKDSVVILELSSFQLQDLKHSPDVAVVLDIFEDHMDSHKNFKEYTEAKANIAKWQKKSGKVFYFENNKYAKQIAKKSAGKKYAFSADKFNLFKQEDLKIPGFHNFKNAGIAAMVVKNLSIKPKIIKNVIKNFRGLEHRLEFVRKIGGISFYNDSISTNPHAAVAAIKSFKEPKILIAGGKDKNLDYSPLAKALKSSNTKLIILYGENKEKIIKTITKIKNDELKIKNVKNLEQAVELAYKFTKSLNPVILLSPASASFDMFSDYKERGKKFKEVVMKLK